MCSTMNIKMSFTLKRLKADCALESFIMNLLMIIKTTSATKLLIASQAFKLFFFLFRRRTKFCCKLFKYLMIVLNFVFLIKFYYLTKTRKLLYDLLNIYIQFFLMSSQTTLIICCLIGKIFFREQY